MAGLLFRLTQRKDLLKRTMKIEGTFQDHLNEKSITEKYLAFFNFYFCDGLSGLFSIHQSVSF